MESLLHPISSEIDLRNSERDVVENTVQKLMDATYADITLRNYLGLNGTLTFESHTNPGTADDILSESMDQVFGKRGGKAIGQTSSAYPERQTARGSQQSQSSTKHPIN